MTGSPTVLLKVKAARQQTALHDLREARAAVKKARAQLDARRKELDDYRAWRPPHERELYDEIQGKEVSLGDLEELNAKIVGLREHEQSLMEDMIKLERALETCVDAESTARTVWQAAQREVEKVEELLADWQLRERMEIEHKAEMELEEFSRPRSTADH